METVANTALRSGGRGVSINKLCEIRAMYVWHDNGLCREKDCHVENCAFKPKKTKPEGRRKVYGFYHSSALV